MYGITPDLTTLGKVIGGGLPVGAFGGRREIMKRLSPAGGVYQAGTLSGNPMAMSAGIATLEILREDGFYRRLEEKSSVLADAVVQAAAAADFPIHATRVGSMLCVFFSSEEVHGWATAARCDTAAFGAYFRAMLDQGIYLAPSQFETAFVSIAHTDEDIERTAAAARSAFRVCREREGC